MPLKGVTTILRGIWAMFKKEEEVLKGKGARPKLGEMLLAEGIITEEQLKELHIKVDFEEK